MKSLSIALCFSCFLSYAQKGFLTGTITDSKSKEPIMGAQVLDQNNNGALTDFDGKYKLELPAGQTKITVRLTGYKNTDTTINVSAGATVYWSPKLAPEDLELDAVVVAAGRFEQKIEEVSVSMAIIKPALIENKATTSCERIIEQVPGVTVQDGQVSIRGGSGFAYGAGSRVLIMIDELPYLSADANDAKWNVVPVENIEQIEVIKGASSVLYGSSALNGVINVRTGYPRSEPQTKINVQHGVYADPERPELKWWDESPYFMGGNFYHSRVVKENLDLVVGGNVLSSIGYRQGEDEDRMRFNFNTRYRSKKVKGLSYGLNGIWQFARTGVYVLWESDSMGLVPQGGADPNNPGTTLTFQDGYRYNFDPHITYYDKNNNRHSLRTRWFRTNNVNNQGRAALADLYYGEYQFQKYYDTLRMNLTTGVSSYSNVINSDLYGDHQGKNVAAFAQLDKKFGARWNVSGGMRIEYFKLDSAETVSSFSVGSTQLPFQPVFRTGATFKAAEFTFLRTSWGQGYRFPSVAEKYASTNIGAVTIFPNPDLNPERGWSAEIGVKQGFKIGKWNGYADVAGFWTEYKNMIEFSFVSQIPEGVVPSVDDPESPNYLYKLIGFKALNSEDARITGVDFSLVGTGKLGPINLTIFGGYTYMNPIALNADSAYRATFSDTTSNMLKYRYRHLIKGDIQIDYKGWSFGVSSRYNSFMENIDQTFIDLVIDFNGTLVSLGDQILPGLPAYRERDDDGALVFDTRMSYEVTDHAKVAFVVNNILNEEYTGRPGDIRPPRTLIGQVTINF